MVNTIRALLVGLLLTACAPVGAREHVDLGNVRLNEGKAAEALEHFESALVGVGAQDPELRLDAAMGKCEALASVDAQRCTKEFVRLADRATLGPASYNRMTVALYGEAEYEEALTVLEHGKARFPEQAILSSLIQKVGRALEASQAQNSENEALNEEVKKRLESLGYVGNDALQR
jgi:hypothetical protein